MLARIKQFFGAYAEPKAVSDRTSFGDFVYAHNICKSLDTLHLLDKSEQEYLYDTTIPWVMGEDRLRVDNHKSYKTYLRDPALYVAVSLKKAQLANELLCNNTPLPPQWINKDETRKMVERGVKVKNHVSNYFKTPIDAQAIASLFPNSGLDLNSIDNILKQSAQREKCRKTNNVMISHAGQNISRPKFDPPRLAYPPSPTREV